MQWKLKDILFMAIAAAILGVVYLGNVYLGGTITAAITATSFGQRGRLPRWLKRYTSGCTPAPRPPAR